MIQLQMFKARSVLGWCAAVAVTASAVGYAAKSLYESKLAKAEENVEQAVARANTMQKSAEYAIAFGANQKARADKLETEAAKKHQAANVETVIREAPDTCKKVVAALAQVDSAYQGEKEAAGALKIALDATTDTLKSAQQSLDALAGASQHLVNVIKRPSLLSRLKPHINVNPTDLQYGSDGKLHVGISIGLGWSL